MNQMTRKQKRAIYEINIVKSCEEKYEDKTQSLSTEMNEIKASIDVLEERIVATENHDLKLQMVREIKRNKRRYDNKVGSQKNFANVVEALDILLSVIEEYYDRERYDLIVKIIPEKKLGKMISNFDKFPELLDLIAKTLSKFRKSMDKAGIDFKNFSERIDHVEKVSNTIHELTKQDSDEEKMLAEIEARKAKPVTAEELEQVTLTENKRINKA